VKITNATIKSLTLPPGVSEKIYFDDDVRGLGVRIRKNGSKHFVVQYSHHNTAKKISLGPVGGIDVSKAKATAKDIMARVRLGEDPAGEKAKAKHRAETESFGALLPAFLKRKALELKPRSLRETERYLMVTAASWHGRAMADIGLREIAARLLEVAEQSGPAACKRFRSNLSDFWRWALCEGFVESNVVSSTQVPVQNAPRERCPDESELVQIWKGAEQCGGQYGSIVQALMLTGMRRQEVGGLRWDEVDLDKGTITIPGERNKSGSVFVTAISAPLKEIIEKQPRDSEFVFGDFQGWTNGKRMLDKLVKIEAWTLHDLRRSVSTSLHETLHIQPHIIEAILNHRIAGVAGIYNRSQYIEEKRRALSRWADHLQAAVEGRQAASNVVALKA
jgi:integrase